jgi:arylsulfatase A-like enzyme
METRPTPSAPLRRAATGVALAWLILVAIEIVGGLRLGVRMGGARLLALGSVTAALVVVAACLGWAVAAVDRRVAPGKGGWIAGALALWPAWLVARSLFSGGWISTVPGVDAMVVGFALALAASVVVATRLARRAADGAFPPGLWMTFVCAGLLGSVLADQLLFVGHYPAFHLLLAASTLACALLLGERLGERLADRLPQRVATGGALLVAIAALGVPAWGGGHAADALVTYTHGLVPKARLVVASAADLFQGHEAVAPLPEFGTIPPPELLASNTDPGRSPWSRDAGLGFEGGRAVLTSGGGVLKQQLPTRHLAGRTFTAGARLRRVDGEGEVTATLRLRDLRDGNTVESVETLGAEWSALEVTLDALQERAAATAPPPSYVVEPKVMRHNEGLAWVTTLPEELQPLADNVRPKGSPGLVLLEDGERLGPVQNVHKVLRAEGGGRWSTWTRSMYFSTPDGSDPTTNGRRYELVREVDLAESLPPDGALAWSLILAGEGAVELDQTSLVEPLPSSGAELAERLAEEFRLVPSDGAAVQTARDATRNVIVIVLDAIRQDHVGPRDDGVSLTPELDAMAAQGVTFAQTYSPSDHTGRSVPCLATGLPLEVTLRATDWGVPLRPWLELLREAGFDTFNNGSDYITRRFEHVPLPELMGAAHGGTLDSKATDLAAEIVEFAATRAGRPFAVATHWSYAHVGRRSSMAAEYAEMVSLCDAYLGDVLLGLERLGLADETLVVVTADHGYGLGESDRYLGAHGCAELSLRVPMVMRGPGLPAGAVVQRPVGNLSVAPTVLDLLLPDTEVLLGAPSLVADALGDGADRDDVPVFSSMGFSFMTRAGSHKLTEDRTYRTAGLFDLSVDPREREPLVDPALDDRLRALRRTEEDRQARLSQALVAANRAVLTPDVMAAFAASRPSAGDVAPLLERSWDYDERTHEFLLAELYRRGIEGLADRLDGLARDDGSRRDDLMLVVRAWAGSDAAVVRLTERVPELHQDARLWLGAMLPDLDPEVARALAEVVVEDARNTWSASPEPGGADERWVALVCHGLTPHLPSDQQGQLKDLSIELFNAWSQGDDEGPYFPTLRDRRFMRRMLLDVFRDAPAPEDLERADRLVHNRHVAERLPRMCRELGSIEAQDWMLDLLRNWDARREDPPGKFVGWMIPELVQFEDPTFRQEASAIIQERWPYQPAFD